VSKLKPNKYISNILNKWRNKMAKKDKVEATTEEVVDNAVDTGAGETEFTGEQGAPESISLVDLDRIAQIIDLASSRGAFRGNELAFVGNLYNKLFNFLSTVKAQQEANAETEGEESPQETAGE
jgi:hypothetical protein